MPDKNSEDRAGALRQQINALLQKRRPNLSQQDIEPLVDDLVGLVEAHTVKLDRRLNQQRQELETCRTLASSPLQGVSILQDTRMVSANTTLARMLGYTVKELLAMSPEELSQRLLHPDDHDETVQSLHESLAGQTVPSRFKVRARHKDGSVRWLEQFVAPTTYRGAPALHVVSIDVTEQQQTAAQRDTTLTALHESEERSRTLVETSPDSIVLTDLEGRILMCNQQTAVRYGYADPAEMVGVSTLDLIAPEERARAQENLQRGLAGEHVRSTTYRAQSRDGKSFFIEIHAALIRDAAGQPQAFIGITRDVTERVQAEQEIHHQADLLQRVSDAIISTDLDFNIVSWNRAAEEIYGWPADEVLGQPVGAVTQITYPHHDENEVIAQFLEKGHWEGEFIQRHKDTSPRHIYGKVRLIRDDTGQPVGAVAVNRDITERKQAEQRLRFQAQLLNSVHESVVATDLKGKILYWGQGAERLYGYTKEEVLGKSITLIVEPKEAAEEEARMRQVRETGSWRGQYLQQRKDGSSFWADTAIFLMRDETGQPQGLIRIDRDVTERKRSQEELYRYAERLNILHEIDRALLAAQSPQDIARATLHHLRQLIPYQRASVSETDLQASKGRDLIVVNDDGTKFKASRFYPLKRVGRLIDTLEEGRAKSVPDIAALSKPDPLEEMLLGNGLRAYFSAPLIVQDRLLGALSLAAEQPGFFVPEHVETVEEVANSLAVTLHQAQLYEQTKKDAETKTLLLREVNHRVKNNLQAILHLIEMQADQSSDPETHHMLQDLRHRVLAMALVHQELYSSDDLARIDCSGYLEKLVASLYQGLARANVRWRVEVDDVFLPLDTALPCGLIVAELVSNALAHAFPIQKIQPNTGQEIRVALEGDGNIYTLQISDNGVGLPPDEAPPGQQGLGLALVHSWASHQLQGKLDVDTSSHGTTFTITFQT